MRGEQLDMRLKPVLRVLCALLLWCVVVLTCYLDFWFFAGNQRRYRLSKLLSFGLGKRTDPLPTALR